MRRPLATWSRGLGWLGLVGWAVCGTGCRPDDTQPPQLAVVVNGRLPWERVEVQAGEGLQVTVDARDDRELNEIRLEVAPAAGAPFEFTGPDGWVFPSGDWEWTASGRADGKQRVWSQSRTIPVDQRGRWVVRVEAEDAAGNVSEPVVFQLDIGNDSLPTFRFTSIHEEDPQDWTSVPVWPAGAAIALEGAVEDTDGLGLVSLTLYDAAGLMVWSWAEDASGATVFQLGGVMVELPAGLTGDVEMRCRATDGTGRTCDTGFPVRIE